MGTPQKTVLIVDLGTLMSMGVNSWAQDNALGAKGLWVEGAAGVQASGLAGDATGQLWTVGDQNTQKDGAFTSRRLFKIFVMSRNGRDRAFIDAGKVVFHGSDTYDGDFEAVCAGPNLETMFAATESFSAKEPRKPLSLFEFNSEGRMRQRRTELQLERWASQPSNLNRRLEGIACDGDRLFLAYERPPRILMLSVADARRAEKSRGGDAVTPMELQLDLSGVHNINGLAYLKRDGKEYLLAIARDQQMIITIQLRRHHRDVVVAAVKKTTVRFISPDSDKELCWASPEGIAVSQGRIWMISDPAYSHPHNQNYRELRDGEQREDCHRRPARDRRRGFIEMVPILFSIAEAALFVD